MSRAPVVAVVDCETLPIMDRPFYPPPPVGVSVRLPGEKRSTYYAFGHPSGNTHTWQQAREVVARAYQHEVAFHNAKFDLDVIETHLGIPRPAWNRCHDTLFMAFLDDPRRRDLGLKPLGEEVLGLPPAERDEVLEWLLAQQPLTGVKMTRGKQGQHYVGRYIGLAPPSLVGPYACGDTDRTLGLFQKLWVKLHKAKMLGAYDRERQLLPILLEMERQGVPVDLPRLRRDVAAYIQVHEQLGGWIRKQLKAPDLNLDAGEQLAAALSRAGKLDEHLLPLTETGKPSTAADALAHAMTDKRLLSCLTYYGQLSTCLRTFMTRWLATAEASGGLIFTTWNQTRGDKGGTRTGRLSSTPNFQNIPNEFKPLFSHEQKGLPKAPFDLPPLPRVRSYVVPFEGHVLIDRDYSQQEPRILAHYDGGQLMTQYQQHPWTDLHDYARAELELMGLFYERKPVKNTNLGLIYGMGVAKLAEKNGMTIEEARQLKKAILKLYPGLDELYDDMKALAATGEPIRTWGGRVYHCEEPKVVQGRLREFDYKQVNVLIQGSAADCTKEALIRYHERKSPEAKIILNVHDQVTVSVPKHQRDHQMEVLRASLESVEFDVPMLSEGSVSATNWDELQDYDKKGVRL